MSDKTVHLYAHNGQGLPIGRALAAGGKRKLCGGVLDFGI
jgi:hypothetical protein